MVVSRATFCTTVRRYIRLGQIGLRLGDTLFVHGAVTDNTLLWVPSWSGLKYRQLPEADGRVWSVQQPSTTFEALAVARANVEQNMASSGTYLDPQTASVDQWLLELETFREKSVADFETRPFWHTSGKLAGARHEHAPVPQSSGLTRKTPAEPDDGDGSGGSPPQLYDSNNASSLIGLDSQRGGEALMAYQSTPATGGRSVVVTAYMRGSHVNHLGPEACRFLLRGNPQVACCQLHNGQLLIRPVHFFLIRVYGFRFDAGRQGICPPHRCRPQTCRRSANDPQVRTLGSATLLSFCTCVCCSHHGGEL